jgi:hypothetical protein
MTVDRRTLARIDRCLLSKLDGDGGPQLVKVPVSDAVWDVWRRHCRLAGVTMGEGLAALLAHDLLTEVGEVAPADDVLGGRLAAEITELRDAVAGQKRLLETARVRLRQRDEQIRALEQQLRVAKHQLETALINAGPARERVGRNDACPCGSGLKYKLCHATSDRLSGR